MDRSERKIKQTVSHNAETADRDRVKNKFAVKIIGVEERKSQESLQWGRKRNVIRKQAHTGLG